MFPPKTTLSLLVLLLITASWDVRALEARGDEDKSPEKRAFNTLDTAHGSDQERNRDLKKEAESSKYLGSDERGSVTEVITSDSPSSNISPKEKKSASEGDDDFYHQRDFDNLSKKNREAQKVAVRFGALLQQLQERGAGGGFLSDFERSSLMDDARKSGEDWSRVKERCGELLQENRGEAFLDASQQKAFEELAGSSDEASQAAARVLECLQPHEASRAARALSLRYVPMDATQKIPNSMLETPATERSEATPESASESASEASFFVNTHEVIRVPSERRRTSVDRPCLPFSGDFTASAARRWSVATTQKTAAVASEEDRVQPGPRKVVISDDFPEHSWLRKMLGNFYAARCNLWRTYFNPPELEYRFVPEGQRTPTDMIRIIPKYEGEETYIHPDTPLRRAAGITGLSNRTGDCGMNAALQVLKVTLNSMREGLPLEERQQLEARIQERTPQLWRFLENEIVTHADNLELKREIAEQLSKDYWYSYHAYSYHTLDAGIAQQSVDTGYIKSMNPSSILLVLLHQLEAPQVYTTCSFKDRSRPEETSYHSAHSLLLDIDKDQLLRDPLPSIEELVASNFQKQGRLLDDPAPPTLAVNLMAIRLRQMWRRGITAEIPYILDSISLPHQNGNSIVYQPNAVLLITRGHAFAMVKARDRSWYEVDDNSIALLKPWEKSLEQYIGKKGSIMIYEKIPTEDLAHSPKIAAGKNVMAPTEMPDLSAFPALQKIERLNALLEGLNKLTLSTSSTSSSENALLPDFFFHKEWRNSLLRYRNTSFIDSQKAKLIEEYASLVQDDPVLHALQEATNTKDLEKFSAAKVLLEEHIRSYEQNYEQATPELQPFWARSIATLRHCSAACSSQIHDTKVDKVWTLARAALKRATSASNVEEAAPLYEETIALAREGENFLDQIIDLCKQAQDQAPERLKVFWRQNTEVALKRKLIASEQILELEALKAKRLVETHASL